MNEYRIRKLTPKECWRLMGYTDKDYEKAEKINSNTQLYKNVFTLKDHVRNNYPTEILISICNETIMERFNSDSDEFYSLAYRIEPPSEPKYKPFESAEKAMEVIMKHGGWVKRLGFEYYYLIKGCCSDGRGLNIYTDVIPYTAESFFCSFIFADDGSPCGELVEE